MCDNLVVLPGYTSSDRMLFAKNSDRPAYESQPIAYNKRQSYHKKNILELAYIKIPQVDTTYLTIGSSPYWCWGYEQGANEHGVVIGNEAIFTKELDGNKEKTEKGNGIIGMELVRLGLERSENAKQAVEVITNLVESYGQWGNATVEEESYYNNSFIIADAEEAWVLETVDENWIAKKINDDFQTISNEMGIRKEWSLISDNFIENAVRHGWYSKDTQFDAAFTYTDFNRSLQVSHIRAQRTKQLLNKKLSDNGLIGLDWMKRILRDHFEDTFIEGPKFNAALPDFQTVCMHSSPANFTWGITAASTIFEVPKEPEYLPIMWWAPTTPCTSIYLPVFLCEQELPDEILNAGEVKTKSIDPEKSEIDKYSEDSYWWKFRKLLDDIKGDRYGQSFDKNQIIAREVFDKLEKKWQEEIRITEKIIATYNKQGEKKVANKIASDFTKKCLQELYQEMEILKPEITS